MPENTQLACRLDNLAIVIEKEGNSNIAKSSYPIRYGKYSEIKTKDYEFHFNLNGEIKFIRGLKKSWPHPSEWLKRSDGNDWGYYSVGAATNFRDIHKLTGEYYLPCLNYPSNSIIEFNPYTNPDIASAFAAWSQLYANLSCMKIDGLPSGITDFLSLIINNNEDKLIDQSKRLHSIIGGQASVLPPDTRHVDYEVIPLNISDGCLYNCRFCCVKSHKILQPRSWSNILDQIQQLKTFYNRNIANYNALFLGNHDALGVGEELICMAASEAFKAFGFKNSNIKKPVLFLFGSVGTLLKAGNDLFKNLSELPFYTYINIGLESIDAATLAFINKPLEASDVREALDKMLGINRDYPNIEITANFLLGDQLPYNHKKSLAELLNSLHETSSKKGAIYLSPLKDNLNREALLKSFFEIKKISKLPAYIYLIQRL